MLKKSEILGVSRYLKRTECLKVAWVPRLRENLGDSHSMHGKRKLIKL